jgi:hypothetical protein
MKGCSTSLLKLIGVMVGLVLIAVIAFAIDIYISRKTYTTIYDCLDQIEIGDSSAEVIEKMKPYKEKPDKVYENDSVYHRTREILEQAELHYSNPNRDWRTDTVDFRGAYYPVATFIYYARWESSSDIYFYFPTGQDTLFDIYHDL